MKAVFTCSYRLVGRPLAMDMNFPHDRSVPASSKAISLRQLDMDVLRALAFAPVLAPRSAPRPAAGPQAGQAVLMALFAGSGRADLVPRGSFNPHFAAVVDRIAAQRQQGETDVYHCGSVNRKDVRLLRPHASICPSQAF